MNSSQIEAVGPACDFATIAALRDEGDNLLTELIEIFTTEAPCQMTELERALAQQESAAAARIAHTLKGTAGVFGASMMESLAARIERSARRASFGDAIDACGPLRVEIARVMATLAGCQS